MKIWKKYEEYLISGEWHIHTNYTDGAENIFNYCNKAEKMGIPLLAFTEHVRSTLDYNFNDFLSDIENAREEFDIIILSGCEAKVLTTGELDVNKDTLKEIDYPIFAFHSFPEDTETYYQSLKAAIKNEYVNTWAHPGLFFKKNNIQYEDEELNKIFELMKKHNVLLEINEKYNLPTENWISMAQEKNVKFVKGNDVHNLNQLTAFK